MRAPRHLPAHVHRASTAPAPRQLRPQIATRGAASPGPGPGLPEDCHRLPSRRLRARPSLPRPRTRTHHLLRATALPPCAQPAPRRPARLTAPRSSQPLPFARHCVNHRQSARNQSVNQTRRSRQRCRRRWSPDASCTLPSPKSGTPPAPSCASPPTRLQDGQAREARESHLCRNARQPVKSHLSQTSPACTRNTAAERHFAPQGSPLRGLTTRFHPPSASHPALPRRRYRRPYRHIRSRVASPRSKQPQHKRKKNRNARPSQHWPGRYITTRRAFAVFRRPARVFLCIPVVCPSPKQGHPRHTLLVTEAGLILSRLPSRLVSLAPCWHALLCSNRRCVRRPPS